MRVWAYPWPDRAAGVLCLGMLPAIAVGAVVASPDDPGGAIVWLCWSLLLGAVLLARLRPAIVSTRDGVVIRGVVRIRAIHWDDVDRLEVEHRSFGPLRPVALVAVLRDRSCVELLRTDAVFHGTRLTAAGRRQLLREVETVRALSASRR